MKRPHIHEINITRALAIIGVLIVHATSFPVSQLDPSSSLYGAYTFTNTFFRFGTPTFIFLSSFVLFYSYYYRSLNKQLITRFYKNRLLYIILPYIIFSIAYYMYNYPYYSTVMTNQEILTDFLVKLGKGEAFSHLYFVFISIQFYLMFPLFLVIFKKYPRLVKHSIWIGFALQWAFILINSEFLHITNKGSISFSYMSYYFLGVFFGVYYENIMDFFRGAKEKASEKKGLILSSALWIAWFAATFTHGWVWFQTRTSGIWYHALTYELLWNVHTILSAIVLTQMSYVIYKKVSNKMIGILTQLGAVSFGIYLIHLLVLNYYQDLVPDSGNVLFYHLKSVGGFFITLALSWFIVTIITRNFKYSWILFGSAPKPTKAKRSTKQSRTPA